MGRLFKRYRIGYLYFYSFFLFALIVLVATVWLSYRFSVQSIANNTSFYQAKLLSELNRKLQVQFSAIESLSLSVSRNNDIMEFLNADYSQYDRLQAVKNVTATLSNLTFSMPTIFSMNLYIHDPPANDPQGPVQYLPLENMADKEWYPVVEVTDFVWIGEHPIDSYQGRTPVISFARKLYSKAGVYKGVLLVHIKTSTIQKLLREQDDLASNRLLLDSGGRIISYIGFTDSMTPDLKQYAKLIQENNRQNRSYLTREIPLLGSSLIVWSDLVGYEWLLIEVTPWNRLMESSRHMAAVTLTIGLAIALLALIMVVFLNKQFTRPIYLLLTLMKSYPFGKNKQVLPVDYHNEFGQLFNGFRGFIERIEELYQSLEKQHRIQREVEISALQAAINPHFLYNTLDQVNWMAIHDGNIRMSQVLELTGKMLRISLSNGEPLISLAEELEHVECYMKIQQIRLPDKIEYQITAANAYLNYKVPKLTLQPFVENSIKHGFHGRAFGRITIDIQEQKLNLIIRIHDNGNGFNAANSAPQNKVLGGYGIRNVRERMAAFFGDNYSIDIMNAQAGGTIVTIRFPRFVDESDKGGHSHVENSNY